MGSAGEKRSRRGGKRQHLDKVGSRSAAAHEQHLEREAIGDVMGLGGTSGCVRWTAIILIAVFVIGGIVSLIALD